MINEIILRVQYINTQTPELKVVLLPFKKTDNSALVSWNGVITVRQWHSVTHVPRQSPHLSMQHTAHCSYTWGLSQSSETLSTFQGLLYLSAVTQNLGGEYNYASGVHLGFSSLIFSDTLKTTKLY